MSSQLRENMWPWVAHGRQPVIVWLAKKNRSRKIGVISVTAVSFSSDFRSHIKVVPEENVKITLPLLVIADGKIFLRNLGWFNRSFSVKFSKKRTCSLEKHKVSGQYQWHISCDLFVSSLSLLSNPTPIWAALCKLFVEAHDPHTC